MTISHVKDSSGSAFPKPNKNMITYDSRYYINNNSSSYFYANNYGTGLNSRDKITYIKEANSGLCYNNNAGGFTEFGNGTCYYTYMFNTDNSIADQYTVDKYIFLTEDYEYCNFNPKIGTNTLHPLIEMYSNGTGFTPGDSYSYLQLQKMYGFNFLPLNIESSPPSNPNISVKSRKDYISDNGVSTFNLPIGYFSDTSNIISEIQGDKILLTYIYNDNISQSLNLSYQITSSGTNYLNTVEYNSSESNIRYNIENSFTQPCLKVPSTTSYLQESAPYKLDQVRYFDDSNDTDTINFLSTYKDIEPDKIRTQVSNICNLRKTTFEFEDTPNLTMKYEGLVSENQNLFEATSINFGNTYFYTLHSITESLITESSENNVFLGGSNAIIFRNQEDIETILKYGSMDLVIGFGETMGDNAIAITKINSYDVDNTGKQTLSVETSTYIPYGEKIVNPKLYINNIFPMNVTPEGGAFYINDGRVLYSSCVPVEESPDYAIVKTSYNKIINRSHNPPNPSVSQYSFFDFYFFKKNTIVTTGSPDIIFFRINEDLNDIVDKFNTNNHIYSLKFTSSDGINDGGITENYIYIVSDNFLSSILLTINPFLNNTRTSKNFSILGKFVKNGEEKTRVKGEISMKLNTRPFYTGIPINQGLLDETYLNEIMWPYWINNLNIGTLKITKLFLNWNPGNMENEMFYYAFGEMEGVKMLLYLSTNFSLSSVKESQPVPIILSLGEKLDKNIFMLPYNKKLAILSKQCV